MKNKYEEQLMHLGMYWDSGEYIFDIPKTESMRESIAILNQNKVSITWNSLSTFEQNPTSLPQTETILKGQSVSGISIDHLMQVRNYGRGLSALIDLLRNGNFECTIESACKIHNMTGQEEDLTWGKIRNSSVYIDGADYDLPEHTELPQIAEKGFKYLESHISDPSERAIITFLFMARTQFFHDVNKRTASIMMNGVLVQNNLLPIMILNRDSEQFHVTLRDFYKTKNANGMLKFFQKYIQQMYIQHKKTQSTAWKQKNKTRM